MNTPQTSSIYNVQETGRRDEIQRGFIIRVYGWMTIGLLITAGAALFTISTPGLLAAIVSSPFVFLGLLAGEIVLVLALSFAANRVSPLAAGLLFTGYAILNGTSDNFEVEEAAKAAHLGANGIVGADLADKKELYRLEELFRRYRPVEDKRTVTRVVPSAEEALVFAFTHPVRRSLVAGKIREISIQGASFKPAPGSVVSDLEAGCRVPVCSLKLADGIVDLSARVTRNRAEMGFQFLDFETDGRSRLLAWIEARSQRALKNAVVPPATQPS